MLLRELLPREHVLVPLPGDSIHAALGSLGEHLARAAGLDEHAPLQKVLREPRARDVLVAGDDAVIVHSRTEAVDRSLVALGVAPRPLGAAEAGIEAEPRIVAVVLAPPGAASLYLQTVSALAGLLRQERVAERIAAARTPDDVLSLRELRTLKIQPRLTVSHIMAHRVVFVSPDTSMREAIDRMIRHRLRTLPVVGEKREVLGMITDRDVLRVLLPQIPRAGEEPEEGDGAALEQLKVREVMTRSVLCITDDMGLEEVANLMINKDVGQLPVVAEGRLAGFVTRGDIIRKLFRQ